MTISPRRLVAGPAIVLPGDDIDTDRIMPARFLRAITFDGIRASRPGARRIRSPTRRADPRAC